jgi:hypothetical protein
LVNKKKVVVEIDRFVLLKKEVKYKKKVVQRAQILVEATGLTHLSKSQVTTYNNDNTLKIRKTRIMAPAKLNVLVYTGKTSCSIHSQRNSPH